MAATRMPKKILNFLSFVVKCSRSSHSFMQLGPPCDIMSANRHLVRTARLSDGKLEQDEVADLMETEGISAAFNRNPSNSFCTFIRASQEHGGQLIAAAVGTLLHPLQNKDVNEWRLTVCGVACREEHQRHQYASSCLFQLVELFFEIAQLAQRRVSGRGRLTVDIHRGPCFRNARSLALYHRVLGAIVYENGVELQVADLDWGADLEKRGSDIVVDVTPLPLDVPFLLGGQEASFYACCFSPPMEYNVGDLTARTLLRKQMLESPVLCSVGGTPIMVDIGSATHRFVIAALPCRRAEEYLRVHAADKEFLTLGDTRITGYMSYNAVK